MNWYQFLFSLNMHVCYEPAIPLPDIQPTGWMFSHNTYPNVKINTIRNRQLKTTQLSVSSRMDKCILVYSQNEYYKAMRVNYMQ